MFHKLVDVIFLEGTLLEATFHDGKVIQYDISSLFGKYPQLRALENSDLFQSGKMMGAYGIIWNDELDIEAETIYEDGKIVQQKGPSNQMLAQAISKARALTGKTQKEVAQFAEMDQSDYSKIERGTANPSISTLERIAKALGGTLSISIEFPEK